MPLQDQNWGHWNCNSLPGPDGDGYYHLTDDSGNSRDLLTTGTHILPGKLNNAFVLNESGISADIFTQSLHWSDGVFLYSWFNIPFDPDIVYTGTLFYTVYGDSTGIFIQIERDLASSNSRFHIRIYGPGFVLQNEYFTDYIVTSNAWHMFTFRLSPTLGGRIPTGLTVNLDNVAIISDPGQVPIPDNSAGSVQFDIATDIGDYIAYNEPLLTDDTAIWERELSATEEAQLWNGGNGTEDYSGSGAISVIIADDLGAANWSDNNFFTVSSYVDYLNLWGDTIAGFLTHAVQASDFWGLRDIIPIHRVFIDVRFPLADYVETRPSRRGMYSYETWAQLKIQLANRLHDPSKVYWTDDELGVLLTEALRTFSFLTWHWRNQDSFNTALGTSLYDITSEMPTYLQRIVTDRNLINSIQYHFQEAITTNWPGGWTGTDMFTMDDLSHALQKRRNKFLAETGVLVTRTVEPTGVPVGGRIFTEDTIIDIRRLARLNSSGVYDNLWRVDEQELTAASQTWSTPVAQDPANFSILSAPPLTIQLSPAPTDDALMDILTISTGPDFIPVTMATVVGVPDDMTWIVKWGAMADLLQADGPAQDLERAAYCEQRYQHGVHLARISASIISARISNSPLLLCPLAELDAYQPGWQSTLIGTPAILATAGLNYIATYPPPSGATTITIDMISNAVIPASDSDYVQIGREMISTILDYSEHLAMFKVAGDEWKTTDQLFTQFLSMCGNYNSRMAAATKLWTDMHNVTNAEESTRIRIKGVRSKPSES